MHFPEIEKKNRYGYIRVSSVDQEKNASLENQKMLLMKEGNIPEENIFQETGSGENRLENRPTLKELTEETLKENNLLMVTKIDRCSRNTLDFLKLQDKLHQKNIAFVSLDLPYSPQNQAVNKLITTTLVAIAEFENQRRRERQRIGIEAAKKLGKYTGRKTVITPSLIREVKKLYEDKELSVTEISKITNRSRNTIYKVLKNELHYVPSRLVKKD